MPTYSATRARSGLQASIAACHATARDAADTDWIEIAGLYAELGKMTTKNFPVYSGRAATCSAAGTGTLVTPGGEMDSLEALEAALHRDVLSLRAGMVRQAIEAALAQTRPPDEIVVADDASVVWTVRLI